jgi:hypothetical protein
MAGEISGVAPKVPNTIDQMADMTKGLGLSDKATQAVKDVAAILGGRNVSINTNARVENGETGRATGATNVPALDDPADLKQLEANLEKLISYLQMDNEERQAQMAKDRINLQKDALETERQGRSEKIEKSLKDMDKAAESRKASKIFGWLMTALAVVAAVVACVATGGLALGPVIGAGIAIACQVLSETGVMDKIVEKLAKGLESLGMSKQAAQILAQVLITVAIMAASLGAGFAGGGGAAVSNVVKGASDSIQTIERIRAAVAIATLVVGVGGTVAGGVSAYQGYKAGESQADVSETNKYITALQQRLSECEEELEQILQQLQNVLGQVAQLLTSATDTSASIANNLGQMA